MTTPIEVLARFKWVGGSCCTDGCVPEAKVLEIIASMLADISTLETENSVLRDALTAYMGEDTSKQERNQPVLGEVGGVVPPALEAGP